MEYIVKDPSQTENKKTEKDAHKLSRSGGRGRRPKRVESGQDSGSKRGAGVGTSGPGTSATGTGETAGDGTNTAGGAEDAVGGTAHGRDG